MTTSAKIAGLTALILLLASALWISVNSWRNLNKSKNIPTVVNEISSENENKLIEPTSTQPSKDYLKNQVLISMDLTKPLSNPFVLSGVLLDLDHVQWSLVDEQGTVLAKGSVKSSDGIWNEIIWYENLPKSKNGFLQFFIDNNLQEPLVSYGVELENRTQTVEVFLRKQASSMDCDEVMPIKRRVVFTGGDKMNYYEAALRSLLQGVTSDEVSLGWVSAIPSGVKLLNLSLDEKGRFTANFSLSLIAQDVQECQKLAIKNQIQQTLATVPVPGRRLPGRVFIEGEEVDF